MINRIKIGNIYLVNHEVIRQATGYIRHIHFSAQNDPVAIKIIDIKKLEPDGICYCLKPINKHSANYDNNDISDVSVWTEGVLLETIKRNWLQLIDNSKLAKALLK